MISVYMQRRPHPAGLFSPLHVERGDGGKSVEKSLFIAQSNTINKSAREEKSDVVRRRNSTIMIPIYN